MFDLLSGLPHVRFVDLSFGGYAKSLGAPLSRSLKSLPMSATHRLTSLDIARCGVTHEAMRAIGGIIANTRSETTNESTTRKSNQQKEQQNGTTPSIESADRSTCTDSDPSQPALAMGVSMASVPHCSPPAPPSPPPVAPPSLSPSMQQAPSPSPSIPHLRLPAHREPIMGGSPTHASVVSATARSHQSTHPSAFVARLHRSLSTTAFDHFAIDSVSPALISSAGRVGPSSSSFLSSARTIATSTSTSTPTPTVTSAADNSTNSRRRTTRKAQSQSQSQSHCFKRRIAPATLPALIDLELSLRDNPIGDTGIMHFAQPLNGAGGQRHREADVM